MSLATEGASAMSPARPPEAARTAVRNTKVPQCDQTLSDPMGIGMVLVFGRSSVSEQRLHCADMH